MAHPPKPADPHAAQSSDGHDLGFERLVFFSDAVFAIGITLLVLDLKLQTGPHGEILFERLIPRLIGFVVSFSVTALYWLAHHRLFKTLRAESPALRGVNLVFLASMVFLAFPSSVVSEYIGVSWAVIFYAVSVTTTGLLMALLVLVARRPALMRAAETAGGTVRLVLRSLGVPIVFTSSCAVALDAPLQAMYLWAAVPFAIRLLDATGGLIGRWIDTRRAL
jgi:uncharacterized membrane protein